jgi:hypothetical protein
VAYPQLDAERRRLTPARVESMSRRAVREKDRVQGLAAPPEPGELTIGPEAANATGAGPTPDGELGAGSGLSAEEAERRLRQVARIWVNGATRAVLAQRARRAQD